MTETVHVAVIEWSGDIPPNVTVATTESAVKRAVVRDLYVAWENVPTMFADDAPEFMQSVQPLPPAAPLWMVDDWLTEFHEATTQPWVTFFEEVVLS